MYQEIRRKLYKEISWESFRGEGVWVPNYPWTELIQLSGKTWR